MKLSLADLHRLRASVMAGVLTFSSGGLLLYFGHQGRESAELARLSAVTLRGEAEGRLQRVRNEENEIKRDALLFYQLQERGVIGEERRLDWVELIEEIRDKRRLLDLRYEIAPQRPLDAGASDDFVFSVSSMKVHVKLLHEEDLTRLLGDLRHQAKALIRVRSCNVERLPPAVAERAGDRANLQAECEIDWLTLRGAVHH